VRRDLGQGGARPAVSIVIPCLNEAGAIAAVVRRALAGLDELGLDGEVIVVDNGSTDGTAVEAGRAGARVVFESRPGYGSALRRGFSEARGDYIVMADGDDTYPIDNLRPFVELLQSGCDVVYGNRFAGGIEPQAMTWSHRYIGTPALSFLVRRLSGVKITDSQCGMRAFQRDALQRLHLRASGMDLNMEMLIKIGRAGMSVGEVPIRLMRRIGESKLQTIPDGWRNLRYLLVVSPVHLFLIPGVGLLILSLLLLMLQDVIPGGIRVGMLTWKPQFAPLILGSVGTQSIWFAVIASMYYADAAPHHARHSATGFLRVASRYFSLEFALVISALMIALGVVLEVLLGLQQLEVIGPHDALASVGAFSMIVGLESFFSSFVAYLLTSDHTRPVPARASELTVPPKRMSASAAGESAAATASASAARSAT
jgi:hypothetical protein